MIGLVSVIACSEPPPAADQPRETPKSTASTVTGAAPRAFGGFPSVVILVPEEPIEVPIPPPAVMDQYNTEFHPRLLLVRVGQTVRFQNSEDTLHNVHVIDIETHDTAFNVATPVVGAYEYVFDNASEYDVSCGIHPSMAAFIVVTDSPFAVVAENDGAFSLTEVPAGNYTARVWNLDPARRSERDVVIDDAATELNFGGMS